MDKPTPTPSIPDLVSEGMGNGLLWVLETEPVWSGHGILKPCIVCRLKIADYEIQYDVVGPRGSLPVHVKCYRIWRAKSDKLRRSTVMAYSPKMQALILKIEAEDAAHFAELREKGKAQADARAKAREVTRAKKLVHLRAAREARAAKLRGST